MHLEKQVGDNNIPPHSDPSHQNSASGLPSVNQMDHSKSHETSGGCPLLAAYQMDLSKSHESSGGHPLLAADQTYHSELNGGRPLLLGYQTSCNKSLVMNDPSFKQAQGFIKDFCQTHQLLS